MCCVKLAQVKTITEGSVTIAYELQSSDTRTKGVGADDGPVFYNKVQVFNRDLSIMMISLFAQWRYIEKAEAGARKRAMHAGLGAVAAEAAGKAEKSALYALTAAQLDARIESEREDGIVILDALAATGLRSIRYAREIPGVKKVISNDLEQSAHEAAKRNIAANGMEGRCEAQLGDAVMVMMAARAAPNEKRPKQLYDVIDLDPYGSSAPFIDAAVQAVADGGLICVTSTDMIVLSGNYAEVCYTRYGSFPTKAKHLHEMALRIVLNAFETAAARHSRHIVPVLSVSVDFYVRLFVRVYRRPIEVKRSCTKRAYVLQSTGCPTFYLQPVGRSLDRNDAFSPANYKPLTQTPRLAFHIRVHDGLVRFGIFRQELREIETFARRPLSLSLSLSQLRSCF